MKKLFVLIISLSCLNIIAQETGDLKGKVIDDFEEPLWFANVLLQTSNGKLMTQTDTNGRFTFNQVPTGIVELKIIYFNDTLIDRFKIKPDEVTFRNSLQMNGNTLGPHICYGDDEIELSETVSKYTITAKEIEKHPLNKDFSSMLASTSSDIQIEEGSGNLYIRGSRSNGVQYHFDGVKMDYAPGMPSAALKSFTVYTGGIPAKYGDTVGGVVVIESKSYMDIYNEMKLR